MIRYASDAILKPVCTPIFSVGIWFASHSVSVQICLFIHDLIYERGCDSVLKLMLSDKGGTSGSFKSGHLQIENIIKIPK